MAERLGYYRDYVKLMDTVDLEKSSTHSKVISDFEASYNLQQYEERITKESDERPNLKKNEVETVFMYIQSWSQRQCMCCFRDLKNFERFNFITQSIICLAVCQLKDLHEALLKTKVDGENENNTNEERKECSTSKGQNTSKGGSSSTTITVEDKISNNEKDSKDLSEVSSTKQNENNKTEEENEQYRSKECKTKATDNNDNNATELDGNDEEVPWSLQDKEKLLHFLSKVFLLNFPLYVAYKHSMHSKLGEMTQQEASSLNVFCDLHDPEIPVFLLRNVSLFCKTGGMHAMTQCFDHRGPDTLPVSIAHAIIAVVCNLKLWLNFRSMMQLFVPLRSKVLRYMCSLSDKDLRTPGIKTMADFMWSAIKDPLDSPLTFDRDGLDLAFKYFTSSTLTMRLAGIAQINSHINMFNELCNNESIVEIENVGQNLANWLIENQIISHIFGPNLHVEVIKQSHVILSFLAMECKITNAHIDVIWQAAQLKHCSKQVHDLLPPLIKNLEAGPVLHLYSLLCKLEPKDHTEQSLYLASALIKFIWTSGGTYSQMAVDSPLLGMNKAAIMSLKGRHDISSSENSISMDVSNSEDEQIEHGEVRKTPSDTSEGPSPCKQTKRLKKKIRCQVTTVSSDESIRVEDIDEDMDEEEDEDEEEDGDEEEDEEEEDDDDDDDEEEEGAIFRASSKSRAMHMSAKALHHCNKSYMNRLASCVKRVGNVKRSCRKIEHMSSVANHHHKEHSSTDNESEADRSDAEEKLLKLKYKRKNMLRKRKMLKKCLKGKHRFNKSRKRPPIDCSDDDEEDEDEDEDIDDDDDDDDDEVDEEDLSESEDEEPKPKISACMSSEKAKLEKSKDNLNTLEADQEVPNVSVREGAAEFMRMNMVEEHDNSHDSMQAGVMTELASLVQGSPHDCRPFMKNLQAHRWFINAAFRNELLRSGDCTPEKNCGPRGRREVMDDLSGDDGSCSSRLSNKSEKNMADFEGEESGCEDELVQLASQSHFGLPHHLSMFHSRFHPNKITSRLGAQFKIENVCKPGSTLLWDLLQDDKIVQLGEGLAVEAEKALCNLLCFNTERLIRMKFIEGCLDNLANNRSVVVSLRLLPKLFASFQQFRGMDTHQITTWAEREHCMMECFFENLKVYTDGGSRLGLYSHQTEIQVRLQFLTSVFSPIGSPDSFRLSVDQVDTLWSCLATDLQCSDELFSWLLSHTKNKDQHALGMDTLKHLYLKKLPTLDPETISMTALGLFQQLCTLARIATAHIDSPFKDIDVVGMDYLWKIALRANNTDVSMAAIQYLNSYYVGRQLDREAEFVSQCMSHLAVTSEDLKLSEESCLLCIQRALLLLKTHLETFRRRYAYHLRKWALEGKAVGSHVQLMTGDKGCISIKLMIQPAGMSEKTTLELLSSDYIGDLRAEVAKWWESIQTKNSPVVDKNSSTPVLGSLLAEGHIRMITGGQELTAEFEEKTLQEMGFKDMQLIFISVGASRQQKKRESSDNPTMLPAPPQESLPTLLLLQPHYFEQLFQLMQTLSAMKTPVKGGHHIPHTKAQVLSRRVWDILTLLPTSPMLLQGFQNLGESENNASLEKLLDPASPQKLMYSLYIVESLSRNNSAKKFKEVGNECSSSSSKQLDKDVPDNVSWSSKFVKHGGLRHIFDIFMSGVLQKDGSEWQQDCLACLLRLLCQLGVCAESTDALSLDSSDNIRNKRAKRFRRGSSEKSTIPKLNEVMMQMMKIDTVMPRLTSILHEASLPRDPNHYKTGFWGRAQVVHYAMALLISWVHSCEEVRGALFSVPQYTSWLQRLVLEDPEPAVRREVCTAFHKLSATSSSDTSSANSIIPHMLSRLFEFLSVAEGMRPQKLEALHSPAEDGKEPYGPACRDYFGLLCHLITALPDEIVKESFEDPQGCTIDIDGLAKKLAQSIVSREYLETRHNTVEDDGLVGLLNLMCNILKHNPPFKTSKEGQEFLIQVFDFLFALPNPRKRYVPKCKSHVSRSSAYDLLVELVKGAPENYHILHQKLLNQHKPGPHSPYPWDYWPHEDGRSDCGYVGLTNLGATCYMASCMQHLYMMPQARTSILRAQCDNNSKHEMTLKELQRMFAYLLESERKAYNPKSFCKVYTMDHQPLNTGEQKDMAEFFIDLVSKLEEMTPELKKLVKTLFGGVISNNVVSLDCDHVSRTLEEFYTVRCQVADMRNLYESLDEVTVKDTLEGDNMYTCSQCGKKVRAEKRACFKKLPHILCFNTMRYTFNMVTMLKEKVNTHFSFPLRLDMSGYVEKHLMPQRYQEEKRKSQLRKSEVAKDAKDDTEQVSEPAAEGSNKKDSHECSDSEDFNECYVYDLIGVTVHTGTADGGHYYSFIRDRTTSSKDKWFLFNDAEVKPFDPNQIAAECFGGEMTSKTYDSVTDKFMDFSFEKTNSAYMLFYEWCSPDGEQRGSKDEVESEVTSKPSTSVTLSTFELSKELEDWIWQDNMHFLRDKNIFEHTYFSFMWQICGYIPQTLLSVEPDITVVAAQLSTSFFLETFIHAKEKPTMVQWVELLTKQFNASQAACEWFLDHMAQNEWWPVQVLIKCPNQMVRQMFQRLCIHVIQRLRQSHSPLYLKTDSDDSEDDTSDEPERIGSRSCVTRFLKMLLSLMEHGAKAHLKHLTEYFAFLHEFSKMGEEESQFLISVQAISIMVNFYLGQRAQDYVEIVSDDEDEEDIIPLPTDKYKPASLDKMVTLIASLVEKSRGPEHVLQLCTSDLSAIAGGKGFPFLYQQIKDNINLNQTRNLIFSLCRWNERLAVILVTTIFQAITKHSEFCQPFFKLLTLLTEPNSSSGLPCFTQLILARIWEVADYCPQSTLDWLALQVPRNKLAHSWVLQSMDTWVEHFLLGHNNTRVRAAAAYLLVSLIPSQHFRQGYRASRNMPSPHKDVLTTSEAQVVLHQVYTLLLRLLKPARHYTDVQTHGTMKLTAYFALLTYCVVSRTEKLMFGQYFLDLWQLFHPKLSEPSVPVHHNKQALLIFWHHVCTDCPENINLILQNAHVTKNIAFNYILADHEDQDVIMFNRGLLPAYYGLLRMCAQQSRSFTRHLATHQNLHWAFKNITPHPSQYSVAVDELFKLIQLFMMKYPDSTEQEIIEINSFKKSTLQLYMQILDGRTCWTSFIMVFRTLVENDEDRDYAMNSGGLQIAFEAFNTLHVMYHEASSCHVYNDLVEFLSIICSSLKAIRSRRETKEVRGLILGVKEWVEILRKLGTLLNTYNPPEMRMFCIDILKEIVMVMPAEVIQVLVPLLYHCHAAFQESHNALPMGPYYPRRGHKVPPISLKTGSRPTRPIVQMAIPHGQLETSKGTDPEYDQALHDFYSPYHDFVDVTCRLAVNNDCMSESLVTLSAIIGFEGAPLHFTYFPKLWLDIYHAQRVDRKYTSILTNSSYFVDYVEAVLLDERSSLNNVHIFNFLKVYFPKVSQHVLSEQTCQLLQSVVTSLADSAKVTNVRTSSYKTNGDLRALYLIYTADTPLEPPDELLPVLNGLLTKTKKAISILEDLSDGDSSGDETPPKKPKITDDKKSDNNSGAPSPQPCSSKEPHNIPLSQSGGQSENYTVKQQDDKIWIEIMEKTIIELIAIIEKKKKKH